MKEKEILDKILELSHKITEANTEEQKSIKKEINILSNKLTELHQKKKQIVDCFLADILEKTTEDFHRNPGVVVSDSKETKIFFAGSNEPLTLDNYSQKELLKNISQEELKYYVILLLNNARNYFEHLDIEDIESIANKLLDKS